MSNTELIKELRNLTQAGMKDCNDALKEAGGDLQKAVDIIKTKGKNIVSSRQGKVAAEGMLYSATRAEEAGTLSCLVELNAQTDFTARSDQFSILGQLTAFQLCRDVMNNVSFDPESHKHLVDKRSDLISTTKENIVIRRWWAEEATSPLARVFTYVHSNNQIGVLLTLLAPSVEARNAPEFVELGNDLAMQVAAMNPLGISPEMLPPEEAERQKNIFLTQIKELNKPEAAQAKILEGKFNKWYSEVCLLEQESVVVNKTQVKKVIADLSTKLGGEIKVTTMIRCEAGEGIVQQTTNLAEEVAKLMQ